MDSMLCPVLVGRDGQLAELTAALDATAAGHGRAVYIAGGEGVGKTRLVRAISELADARGFTIMTGRGSPSAVPVPYRPVTEALLGAARRGVVPDITAISHYRAALGALVPEWSSPGCDAHASPVVVAEALLRLLTQAGTRGGLLVLEDLHWTDAETLAVVEYLADNLADSRVLCIFTLRDGAPSAALDLLRVLSARRAAQSLEVPRLTPAAVSQMAAACLGIAAVPAAVTRLVDDCDGLPFAVEEVLAAAVASGQLVRDETGWHADMHMSTSLPSSITGSVRSRLTALGPPVVNVIVAAAVLGRQFDWALLPAVAGVADSDVLDALQRGCDVQLVEPVPADAGTFRFRHCLTREAILADLMPPELASRAAACAEAIVRAHPGLPGHWCELAAEMYVASGQPREAARLLLTLGRRALSKGAISSTLSVLAQARKQLTGGAPGDVMLGIEVDEVAVAALAQSGDTQQLAQLADDLIARLERAGASLRRQALASLQAASTRPGDAPAATARHLAVAAAIADELRDAELTGRIGAAAARHALAAGELDKAERLGRGALAAADAAGLDGWAAEVAMESLEVIGRRERARDLQAARMAFDRMRQIADDKKLGLWRIRARQELGTVAMFQDGSASQLHEVRELAADAGAVGVGAVVAMQLANLLSLGTDLDQALAMALSCQKTASNIKAHRIQAFAACMEGNIAAIRTDRQRAEQAAARAEAVVPGDSGILHLAWGQTRVLASLFEDDLPRALDEDRTATSHLPQALARPRPAMGNYSALLAPRRALALHALLAAIAGDDDGSAIELATRRGADASWNAGCVAYAKAVLAGRDGDRVAAASLAAAGAAAFEPFAPWWNNLARRLVAPSALQDNWGSPVGWLQEAATGFDASSHHQLAAACRGILRQAGERVPRAARGSATVPPQLRRLGVTSREMDVYLLVAQGRSDNQIAASLSISPKTVQTHVASLEAKTGKMSRRELVAHAARHGVGSQQAAVPSAN
jgi:DNA-binding CsgD family transcriptional regulator